MLKDLALAAPTITFDDALRVATMTVSAPIRTNGGRLNLCVLQLAPSGGDIIDADAPRPEACAAMSQLLSGGGDHADPVLATFAPGQGPVVIVAPEYAFGHGDWAELDALVRQQQRPVVLVAGFGATPANQVEAWVDGVGETARELTWNPATAGLAGPRPVNGAWCWVHGFGVDTTCAVLLKNHMEQGTELVALEWIQPGTHLLRLTFEDLDIFPLICADLVQSLADGDQTAIRRVQSVLAAEGDSPTPVLVLGSLLQGVPSNPNWGIAIDNWLNVATLGRPALFAIANVAIDRPQYPESQDAWRSLTGVFGRMSVLPSNQANLRVTRAVGTQNVRGAVLRQTSPYAAAGPLAWPPYVPTGERFFWHAGMGARVAAGGFQAPIARPPETVVTELHRFTRRVPVGDHWCPRVKAGLTDIRTHLDTGQLPEAKELLSSLLHGVMGDLACGVDEVANDPNGTALTQALHSLATLISEAERFAWRPVVGQSGQLVLPEVGANILVWRDPAQSGRQITHLLGAWTKEAVEHPPLIVLAAGPHGQVQEGRILGHPRDNFAAPPEADANLPAAGSLADSLGDITESRARREVTCVRLERITELYVDYEPGEDAARMTAFIEHLIQSAQAA